MEHLTQVILTLFILSLVTERVTNYLKLKRDKLRLKKSGQEEKSRVFKIFKLALWSGIAVAAIVKADFFEMINPQHTQGITTWEVYLAQLAENQESSKFWRIGFLILGILITGSFVSQGSRFFHDLLDIFLQFKVGRSTVEKVAKNSQFFAAPELQAFAEKEVSHLVFFEDREDEQDNHL